MWSRSLRAEIVALFLLEQRQGPSLEDTLYIAWQARSERLREPETRKRARATYEHGEKLRNAHLRQLRQFLKTLEWARWEALPKPDPLPPPRPPRHRGPRQRGEDRKRLEYALRVFLRLLEFARKDLSSIPVRRVSCPLCGGILELRPGNPTPIHLGPGCFRATG